jgi:pimeloyl-ACP methyl ester carboxylesterase
MEHLIKLAGNYLNNSVQIRVVTNEETVSEVVVVCVHGLYGESGDAGSKSVQLGVALKDSVRASVYISTSRDWSLYGVADDRAEAFAQKTFAQEQADVKEVIAMICEQSSSLFGISPDQLRIWVVANSMGGSLTASIAAQFPQIEKIALCGSGISPSSRSMPILSTYPEKSVIRSAAGLFTGEVLHVRGSSDATVNEPSQQELFEAFTHAKLAQQVVIDGANHNFSSINGKDQQKAYDLYVKTVAGFLVNSISFRAA